MNGASDARHAAPNLPQGAAHSVRAVAALNAELRASEERYRTLFDLGPVAVYSCDASGVIQAFNRRAAELWGREPAPGDTDERFCGSFKMFRPDGSFMPHERCPMAQGVSGEIPVLRHHRAQPSGAPDTGASRRTGRPASPQGRVPRHAQSRAAQPARAYRQRPGAPRPPRPRRRVSAANSRDDGASGGAPDPPSRGPAGSLAHHDRLPGLSGYEVATRMRQQPGMGRVILVAMTGYGQEADLQRSQEAGLDHHLVKPADFSKLQKILTGVRTAM